MQTTFTVSRKSIRLKRVAIPGAADRQQKIPGFDQGIFPLYTSYAAVGVFLWMFVQSRTSRWRVIGWAAIFCAFTFAVGAFQILPAHEYGRLATRFGAPGGFQWNQFVPYAVHALYSLDPLGVPGLVFPTVRSGLVVFVGVTALELGLLGAAANWKLASPITIGRRHRCASLSRLRHVRLKR